MRKLHFDYWYARVADLCKKSGVRVGEKSEHEINYHELYLDPEEYVDEMVLMSQFGL
jgi:hypothetical protein